MDKLEYIRFLTGDIVYIHGSVRVISSCDGYYATYYDEDETLQEVNVNVIECIPLTPEILEKNEWELSHGIYYSPNEDGIGVCLINQTGYVWNAYTEQRLLRGDISSVSDLQHLLFGLNIKEKMEV